MPALHRHVSKAGIAVGRLRDRYDPKTGKLKSSRKEIKDEPSIGLASKQGDQCSTRPFGQVNFSTIGKILNTEPSNIPETGNDFRDFAQKYNVSRTAFSRDESGDLILQGKDAHIYAFSEIRLGVCPECGTTKGWNAARQKLETAGFRITQDGEQEGGAIFDPANREQARLALKLAGVREKRKLSPKQLANLAEGR